MFKQTRNTVLVITTLLLIIVVLLAQVQGSSNPEKDVSNTCTSDSILSTPASPPTTTEQTKEKDASTTTTARMVVSPLIDSSFLEPQQQEQKPRVIIVGAGLAGFSSAIEAARENQDVRVLILEKEERFGGNSAKASSGMNAAPTPVQLENGVNDSIEEFLQDVIKSGGGLSNENLAKILVENSKSAWEFLSQVGGVDMSVLSHCGGHTKMRTHRNYLDPNDQRPKNVGWEVISKLQQLVTTSEDYKNKIALVTKAKVTNLLFNDQKQVIGVQAEVNSQSVQLYANAVILASGGYGQDRSGLLQEYAPDWIKDLPSTNGPFSTGDLIKIANRELDAQMIHMDKVQVHPTGFINPTDPTAKTVFLAAEALRGYGGILVNQQGKRFTNEVGTRDQVTDAIMKHSYSEADKRAWSYMILNQNVVDNFGKNLMGFYIGKGFFSKHENAQDLAKHYNIPEVISTLKEYNELTSSDEYGKQRFPTRFDLNETFYVGKITPSIHYTMGGLKFNEEGRVLNSKDEPIVGLFACGEVTGGLHGNNRLAGNSLLETVVFGRICGRIASRL